MVEQALARIADPAGEGVRVFLRNGQGEFSQACNGECDDVTFTADEVDALHVLKVVDAQGGCVVCRDGEYSGGASLAGWSVAGERGLESLGIRNSAGDPGDSVENICKALSGPRRTNVHLREGTLDMRNLPGG